MTPPTELTLVATPIGPVSDRSAESRCAFLVGSCLRGETDDFAELVSLTEPVVRRLVGRLADSRSDVDDLVQETYLRAWRRLGQFRGHSQFSTWLFRIAVNVTRTWRRSRRPTLELSPTRERSLEAAPEAHDDALMDAYGQALDRLPPDLKAAFVLHESQGLSYREVAEALECPIGTVMSRLHRARARILDELRDRLEELAP